MLLSDFIQIFDSNVFKLSDEQKQLFSLYHELLIEWNEKINLYSRNESDLVGRHFLNSSAIAGFRRFKPGDRLMDIGSGGGFPGIVLKILFPDLAVHLVESIKKKTAFLKAVIDRMAISGIEVVNDRAENLNKKSAFRERYDYVTARAVASLDRLVEWSDPFLKPGGRMLFLKGHNFQEELGDFKKKEAYFVTVHHLKTLSFLPPEQDGVLIELSHRGLK